MFAGYYNDSLDRPTQVIRDYNNVSAKSQTTFSYDDSGRSVTTTVAGLLPDAFGAADLVAAERDSGRPSARRRSR